MVVNPLVKIKVPGVRRKDELLRLVRGAQLRSRVVNCSDANRQVEGEAPLLPCKVVPL